MENKYNYEQAYSEIQSIVEEIESGEINLDELSQKITRAAELILICKAKLHSTEIEVQQLLNKLQSDSDSQDDESEKDEESEELINSKEE